jgi:hypothetical protein
MKSGETFDERAMYCFDACERFGRIFTKASLVLSCNSESKLKAYSVQGLVSGARLTLHADAAGPVVVVFHLLKLS